ncbi:MAG: flagellar basal body P-ring protein FlgI, partial [Acidobacteriaceae bacterium]
MTSILHPAQAHKFCRYRLGVILVGLLLIFEFHSLFGQVASQATLIPTPAAANPVSTSLESSSQCLANPQSSAALPVPAASNAPATQVAMVKAISSVQGIRDNQLIGYGIVVGLQNSGDSQMTYFPLQTLLSTLQRLGITVPYPLTSIMVKNMAGVFVEASLPPFAQPGSKI